MIVLFLVGILPFGIGWLVNGWIQGGFTELPVIAASFLVLWAVVGLIGKLFVKNTLSVVVALNFIAFLDLIFVAVQQFVIGRFLEGIPGLLSQFFFLPSLNFGAAIAGWIPVTQTVFGACLGSFVLMIASSAIGAALTKTKD